jgi:hypothetical protein
MGTMAGMNLTGKDWYSAQGNSVFSERLLRFSTALDDAAVAAESMTGMSTINSH